MARASAALPTAADSIHDARSAASLPPPEVDSTPCLLWMPPKLRRRPAYARVFELEDPTIKIGPVGPVHGIGDMDTAVKLEDGDRVVAATMICNAPLFLVRRGDAVRLDVTTDSGPSVRPMPLFPGEKDRPLDPSDDAFKVVGICRTHTHAHYAVVVGRDDLLITWSDGAFRAERMEALRDSTLRCTEGSPPWVDRAAGQNIDPK